MTLKCSTTSALSPSSKPSDSFAQKNNNDTSSRPMYREKNGDEVFTGIALRGEHQRVKLDDPMCVDLENGAGHNMSNREFNTEMCHYDGSPEDLDLMEVVLKDFSDKLDFEDRQDNEFQVKFPFELPHNPRNKLQIRARDEVKVVAQGPSGSPFDERFWVQVVSVTATGMVTGFSKNNLHGLDVHENDKLAFPITNVLGVIRGVNWD